ncbi:hypothetical protein PR048_000224 [Dryococelus australis]|uniref:Uncharacterized protein n=1 Tax=Dryococelus australis TaxID=614101 RepID=A0ABQ9IE29_9NEOP|nr:hypothetical protein PR048_000224 [Dryococelus australis]
MHGMWLQAFPGMVPYKRPAADKSGMPVYQPSATTYQQLMQPFVPVSCEYSTPVATVTSSSASPATPGGSAPGDEPPSEVDKLPPASSEQAKVGVNPVVALNYTGITLNKQTMAVPPPSQPRYPTPMPTMPVAMSVASPYHPHTAGLLAYSRAGNPAFVSPYSFMRPQFMQSPFTMMPQAQGPFMHNGLLANVMSPYTSMTTPVMTPAHTPTSNNNNNNNSIMSASVALQPYKKMKTT